MKTNQSCKCIDQISENIKKEYGEFHFTNLGSYLNVQSIVGNAELIYKPMPLFLKYEKKIKMVFHLVNGLRNL